jgi:DNA-binding protein H-NS
MKSYNELKAEMEAIQQQMVEAKKNERANALREVKRLCKEFGFTAVMLKDSLAEGRNTGGASL